MQIGEQGGEGARGALRRHAPRRRSTRSRDAAWSRFGGCHLLCNNAGVLVRGPLPSMSDADWRWVLEVNLFGVVHRISAFVPRMIAQRAPAHVVNTASMAGCACCREYGVYTASKFAVVASRSRCAPTSRRTASASRCCVRAASRRASSSRIATAPTACARSRASSRPDSQEQLAAARAREEMFSPDEVGALVLDAVRADEPWVLTHLVAPAAWRRAATRCSPRSTRAAAQVSRSRRRSRAKSIEHPVECPSRRVPMRASSTVSASMDKSRSSPAPAAASARAARSRSPTRAPTWWCRLAASRRSKRPPPPSARAGAARSRCRATSRARAAQAAARRRARRVRPRRHPRQQRGRLAAQADARDEREGFRVLLPLQRHHRVRDDAASWCRRS